MPLDIVVVMDPIGSIKIAKDSTFAMLLLGSVLVRMLIWGGPRDDLVYEFVYQLPFATAVAICAWTVWRALPRGGLDIVLCGLFIVGALHFLAKPFFAVKFGSGPKATDYVASIQALISQSSTGILLTSIGLTLLMICVRKLLAEAERTADLDPLSGLLNRRGFSKWASTRLADLGKKGELAVSIIDLDHFKRLNDTYGHQIGDWFICAVAEVFRTCCGPDAVVARLGGEEFVHVEAIGSGRSGREFGERVRAHLAHLAHDDHPELRVTASIGVAVGGRDVELSDLLARADQALYTAKAAGRNRVALEGSILPGHRPFSENRSVGRKHSARETVLDFRRRANAGDR
jgi:diguanylate cyclase (GGDEF)-like protein